MEMKQIAHIETDFNEKFGIPRQSGRVSSLTARIVFEPAYRVPESLRELTGFSHIWILFDFSLAHRDNWSPTVRPPRLGGNTRVGVFASRSPFRPNPIGLSSVRLLGIEHDQELGDTLLVSGADLLNGTPIFDIKPYLPSSDCHPDASSGYAGTFTDYRLDVDFPDSLLSLVPDSKRQALLDCLAEDPRPSYQNDPNREYTMSFGVEEITFTVSGKLLTVKNVKGNGVK